MLARGRRLAAVGRCTAAQLTDNNLPEAWELVERLPDAATYCLRAAIADRIRAAARPWKRPI